MCRRMDILEMFKIVQLGRRRPERSFKVVVKEEMRRRCGDV